MKAPVTPHSTTQAVHDPFTPPAPGWLALVLVMATLAALLGAAGLALCPSSWARQADAMPTAATLATAQPHQDLQPHPGGPHR